MCAWQSHFLETCNTLRIGSRALSIRAPCLRSLHTPLGELGFKSPSDVLPPEDGMPAARDPPGRGGHVAVRAVADAEIADAESAGAMRGAASPAKAGTNGSYAHLHSPLGSPARGNVAPSGHDRPARSPQAEGEEAGLRCRQEV